VATDNRPTEPALFLTAQGTLPRLTTAMFAFSLAAIGLVGRTDWPAWHYTLGEYEFSTTTIAFALFAVAVLAFHRATEGCVKTHGWDYFALSAERRKGEGISDHADYIGDCRTRMTLWFRRTIIAYRLGFLAVMTGAAVLFAPMSPVAAAIIALYVAGSLLYWATILIRSIAHARLPRPTKPAATPPGQTPPPTT
jgi:hypothetical protein